MRQVGSYEAKTNLATLLNEVEQGARIAITRHGVIVAIMAPPDPMRRDPEEVIREFREFRRGKTLGKDITIKELIEEGRRW